MFDSFAIRARYVRFISFSDMNRAGRKFKILDVIFFPYILSFNVGAIKKHLSLAINYCLNVSKTKFKFHFPGGIVREIRRRRYSGSLLMNTEIRTGP